jgi:hypothetical protein
MSPVLETGSRQLDVKVSALWKVILRSQNYLLVMLRQY